MTADWQVAKGRRVCASTGRDLEVGEAHFSALKEEGREFARLDFSLDAWERIDASRFFSYWRTRVPAPEDRKKRLTIDVEAFYTFFASLENPAEEHRQVFRYLVALILTRKRVLRLDEVEKSPEGETLVLHDRRADETVRVFSPPVSEERLAEAQENLNQIFECQTDFTDEE